MVATMNSLIFRVFIYCLGILIWSQKSNVKLSPLFQSDRDSSKPPPSEVQFVTKPKLHQLSRKEVIISNKLTKTWQAKFSVFMVFRGLEESEYLKIVLREFLC